MRRAGVWGVVMTAALGAGRLLAVGGAPPGARATTRAASTKPPTGLARAGVLVDAHKREITLKGEVVFGIDDIIEYICCVKGSAEHESLVAVKADPLAVRLALMLPPFRLVPGSVVKWDERPTPPTGPVIFVYFKYVDPKTKKAVRVRAEDWVRLAVKDPKTGDWKRRPMRKTGFVFSGGGFYEDPESGRKTFLARGDGAVVTNYNRISSVIDNPQPEGSSDELWYPNLAAMPPVGTPVQVILTPASQPASRPGSRPAP